MSEAKKHLKRLPSTRAIAAATAIGLLSYAGGNAVHGQLQERAATEQHDREKAERQKRITEVGTLDTGESLVVFNAQDAKRKVDTNSALQASVIGLHERSSLPHGDQRTIVIFETTPDVVQGSVNNWYVIELHDAAQDKKATEANGQTTPAQANVSALVKGAYVAMEHRGSDVSPGQPYSEILDLHHDMFDQPTGEDPQNAEFAYLANSIGEGNQDYIQKGTYAVPGLDRQISFSIMQLGTK